MKKIVCLLLLFISVNGYALSLSDIRTHIRNNVNDPSTDTNKQRWANAEIDFLVNQGQREVCDITWCLYTSTNIALVSGTTYYSLPSDTHFIDRVVYNNSTVLPYKPIPLLDREDSDWLSTAIGTPTSYHLKYPKRDIGFSPCPNNTNNIEVFYVKVPSDLSSDDDIPYNSTEILYPYHHLLIDYAGACLFLRDGMMEQYNASYAQYRQGVTRMMRHIGLVEKNINLFKLKNLRGDK